jgi:hypothetical protein
MNAAAILIIAIAVTGVLLMRFRKRWLDQHHDVTAPLRFLWPSSHESESAPRSTGLWGGDTDIECASLAPLLDEHRARAELRTTRQPMASLPSFATCVSDMPERRSWIYSAP